MSKLAFCAILTGFTNFCGACGKEVIAFLIIFCYWGYYYSFSYRNATIRPGGVLTLSWYTYMCLPFGALFREIWYSNRGFSSSGVSWGVHSVRLHPGGSKRGAKKEGQKRKKQGKGEKKRERKGAPKKERREWKENMQKKRKRGKKSNENRI